MFTPSTRSSKGLYVIRISGKRSRVAALHLLLCPNTKLASSTIKVMIIHIKYNVKGQSVIKKADAIALQKLFYRALEMSDMLNFLVIQCVSGSCDRLALSSANVIVLASNQDALSCCRV